MAYRAADDRYDSMTYRRTGRSGLDLPAISLGLWHNFGDDMPVRPAAGDPAPGLRPRHHPLRPGQQLRPALRLGRDQLRPAPRRRLRGRTATSWSSPPRPATTCGPARTARAAAAASTCWPASTSRCAGWAWTTSTSSTRHRPDPTTPLEETMGALTPPSGPGKALYAGISLLLAGGHREGGGDPRRPRDAAADPPALVLDAQPLDRDRGPARHPRGRRRRLHRLLAAGPGHAHRASTWTASRRARAPARTSRCRPSCSPTRRSATSAR